ncbi:MAG: Holliday junction resolvase RuvX [Armatimonadetes bacterium]|nr:Holliday junction resolvase RuvX [Armatimonadota bacterium]
MRVLAVDYGEKRIGLAISDPLEITANPLAVIERKGGRGEALEAIARVVRDEEVEEVVVGLPVHLDGARGPAAEAAQAFADALARLLPVPVRLHDERLTTVAAEEAAGPPKSRRRRRKREERLSRGIDKLAAAVLLRDYLNSRREPGGRAEPPGDLTTP